MAHTNKAHPDLLFEMRPTEAFFKEMYNKNKVNPLYVEFISKNSGAKFTLENKFYPHSWVIKLPDNATKEERDCMRDLALEAIAHPKNAAPDYQPKLVAFFPDSTPDEEIAEFVKASEEKGIQVNLFIGKKEEFDKVHAAHEKETQKIVASGALENLPGWDGYVNRIQQSDGGRKGEEFLNKYRSEQTSSVTYN